MSADKPSEQAIHVAKVLLHLQADKPLPVERLAAIIDEQHRNARAEAFEEAAASCFDLAQARSERDSGIPTSGEYQIGCGDCQRKALALAAKERAQ